MTRRDILQCVHEPFGDAFYYGPERLSSRYENDEKARLDSGLAQSTFRTVLDRIEKEAAEVRITPSSVVSCPAAPPFFVAQHSSRRGFFMLQSSKSSVIPLFLTSMPQHLSSLPCLGIGSSSGTILDRPFFI